MAYSGYEIKFIVSMLAKERYVSISGKVYSYCRDRCGI